MQDSVEQPSPGPRQRIGKTGGPISISPLASRTPASLTRCSRISRIGCTRAGRCITTMFGPGHGSIAYFSFLALCKWILASWRRQNSGRWARPSDSLGAKLMALTSFRVPSLRYLLGLAWLHALHARTCILRGKLWQAEHMIHATRDHVMALACIRHGLPSAHGRGMDALPSAVQVPLLASLVGSLDADELWRALAAVVQSLNAEISHADPVLGLRAKAEISNLARKLPA